MYLAVSNPANTTSRLSLCSALAYVKADPENHGATEISPTVKGFNEQGPAKTHDY
jgi:hypothetical protein